MTETTDPTEPAPSPTLAETPALSPPDGGAAAPPDAEAAAADWAAADAADGDFDEETDEETGGETGGEADEAPAAAVPAGPPRASFEDLGLSAPILQAVHEMDYLHPTPIQEQAIPFVLMGRDVLGCAQTGTGKTASFVLPMMDILAGSRARARMPRSLILEPTRELALQVADNFVLYGKYLKLNHVLIIGGESMNDQKDALMRGVDVLIATPGRLIDLIERGGILLSDTKLLVIDEADRMLDMGFIPDVERIVGLLPKGRQTLFFSATMAPAIRKLADAFLDNPKQISVSRPASVTTTITTGLVLVAEEDKREALRRMLQTEDVKNALIFCNRKRDVDILYKSLVKHGFSAGALHGDMTQPMRFATLEKFKANEIRLLVCSDVAARGLDIGGLSHVFNFDVPIHAEDYVHRIGRTGRAEKKGHAFTIAAPDDRMFVDAIETLTGMPIPRMQVDGVATVHWAEDGGKRRGRGGRGAPAAKPVARAPERTPPKAVSKVQAPASRPSRREEPRQADRQPPYRPAKQPVPVPEPARAEARTAPPPREFRRRDEDLGPLVTGFGDDVPAFMTIRRRAAAVADDHSDHG